jgi:hypothetical protein
MQPEQHLEIAARIERSLGKCTPEDHEMRIEAAMLAGTHRLNAALHRTGVTADDSDVFHSYLLTVNEFRRLCVAQNDALRALAEIEDLRVPYVRGNWKGAEAAGARPLELLARISAVTNERE